MTIKGLEQAMRNLDSLSQKAVPKAKAEVVNRIARKAITASTTRVAKEVKAPQRLVRKRATLKKATASKPTATLRVFLRDMPVIRLSPRMVRGGAVLRAGSHFYEGGFIQRLKNGRLHALRKTPEAKSATGRRADGTLNRNRYPLEVLAIPMFAPLTNAYKQETRRLLADEAPEALANALRKQFKTEIMK